MIAKRVLYRLSGRLLKRLNIHFNHLYKPGTVTVAGNPGVEVPNGTLNAILKQSGLKK